MHDHQRAACVGESKTCFPKSQTVISCVANAFYPAHQREKPSKYVRHFIKYKCLGQGVESLFHAHFALGKRSQMERQSHHQLYRGQDWWLTRVAKEHWCQHTLSCTHSTANWVYLSPWLALGSLGTWGLIRNVEHWRLLLPSANGSLSPVSDGPDERNHFSLMRNPAFSSQGEHSFVPFPHLITHNLPG